MKKSAFVFIALVLALAAFVLSFIAIVNLNKVRDLALSEIEVEERDALSTPVLDQASQKYSFITIYEIDVTNVSGPDVVLSHIKKPQGGSGFIVPVKEGEVLSKNFSARAFVSSYSISEIKENPKRLRELTQQEMGDLHEVNLSLKSGESRSVRIGVSIDPYDENNQPKANLVLTSFEFVFNTGKSYVFRRGFPIYPLQKKSPR